MSDHMPALFNVFEDWNEETVVPHTLLFHLWLIIDYWMPDSIRILSDHRETC